MSRKVGLFRRIVRAAIRRSKARRKAAEKAQKRREAAQRQIMRQSRIKAGEARAQGYEWSGIALPDNTSVEPVFGPDGWGYAPVSPRKATAGRRTASAAGSSPAGAKALCGARTKDGTPCKRRGKCPDHSKGNRS